MFDAGRPVLLLLDVQRFLLDTRFAHTPEAPSVLLECQRWLSIARQQKWLVAHSLLRAPSTPWGALTSSVAAPVPGFEPRHTDPVFERKTLSAYGHPAFFELIERAPLKSAVVASLSASVSYLATAFDAFRNGHRMVITQASLAGQSGREAHAHAHQTVATDVAELLGFAHPSTRTQGQEIANEWARLPGS